MSIIQDTYTLFIREMLIFRKNIGAGIGRAIIFPALFIFLLGSFGSSPKNVPIAIVNYDNTASSLNFINALQSGNNVQVISSTTQQQAMSQLAAGTVAGVVVIPNGFASTGLHNVYVYLDNSQPQSASVVDAKVAAAAQQFNIKPLDPPPPSTVSVVTNYAYGASSNYLSSVVGGILVMVAAFGSVFGSGFTVLSDRELGNLKAFLTTPINKFAILLSKVASGTVQSIFSAYVGLMLGLIYGATLTTGAVGFMELLWIIFLVGLGFSALAITLATKTRQIQSYALVAQSITMPAAFLGGSFVPINLLPAFLLPVAYLDPLTYAVNAVKDIMVKGSIPLSALVFDSGVLIAFTLIMLTLAFMFFKNTSEQL
ncbi:MAG: ABC transporter permease [Candidatus Micrarchaeota archaeon]|nr:ABC transporter permease [Candidatus Micrarchaeota archaeon]MDE1859270.1 ABC transporter permease [Candidatus Micrarchaeota archaeon]